MRGRSPNTDAPDSFLIGPGSGPTRHADSPTDLLDKARMNARCDDEEERQSAALAHRLLLAFVLILIVGATFFVLMPYYGMTLSPVMPVLAFGAIALGALISGPRPSKKKVCNADDGRAVGCCQGPRPLRSFREKD